MLLYQLHVKFLNITVAKTTNQKSALKYSKCCFSRKKVLQHTIRKYRKGRVISSCYEFCKVKLYILWYLKHAIIFLQNIKTFLSRHQTTKLVIKTTENKKYFCSIAVSFVWTQNQCQEIELSGCFGLKM